MAAVGSPVVAARVLFIVLGCLALVTVIYTCLTDGSPFRMELLTPWMAATLVDFYVNVAVIAAWVVYKESTWIGALLWVILLICFGSITTCAYIVIQLLKLSPKDPLYLVLLNSSTRQVLLKLSPKDPLYLVLLNSSTRYSRLSPAENGEGNQGKDTASSTAS